jgi:hypothetical protein
VQHEVVVPARDGQRIELDRPEAAKDFENRVGSSVERTCRREQVACDQEAPSGFRGDSQSNSRTDRTVDYVSVGRRC